MSEPAEITILGEDVEKLHHEFARAVLSKVYNINRRRFNDSKFDINEGEPQGGSGFVLGKFVDEVIELRRRRKRGAIHALVVFLDGDTFGVNTRLEELQTRLRKKGSSLRNDNEFIFCFVPTYHIETWIVFLLGNEVDEREGYKRDRRFREWNKTKEFTKICANFGRCRDASQRPSHTPPSLLHALTEFDRLNEMREQ